MLGMSKTTPRPIKLGNIVRDRITGIEGFATAKHEMLNGNVQYSVQPKADPKEPAKAPDGTASDEHMLEFVSDGVAEEAIPPSEVHFHLGDLVKDTVSGVQGISTQKTTFLNGCVYSDIQPKVSKDKPTEIPKPHFLSYDRLEIVTAGAFKPAKAAVVAAANMPAGAPRPGGPNNPAARIPVITK
jgi:hypothetical protein